MTRRAHDQPHLPPGDPIEPDEPATPDADGEPDSDLVLGQAEPTSEQMQAAAEAELVEASHTFPFGPGFFMTQLRAFVGEQYPEPVSGLPWVEIHLSDGEVLDLCYIIGVTPLWVAIAVREPEPAQADPRTRSEIVPFASITRVTVRSARPGTPKLGFERGRVPRVFTQRRAAPMSPEEALRAAAEARPPEMPKGD